MKEFFSQIRVRNLFWFYVISSVILGVIFELKIFGGNYDLFFLIQNILVLLWFGWKMKKLHYTPVKLNLKKYFQWKEIFFLLVGNIVFSFGVIFLVSSFIAHVFPGAIKLLMEEPPFTLSKSWYVVLINFLGIVLAGPIVEELMFRGILFNRFFKKWGFKTAALVSSLLFGIIHGDLIMSLGAFLFGLTLCVLYVKSHIFVPILIHILNNLCIFLLEFWSVFFQSGETTPYSPEQLVAETAQYGLLYGLPMTLIAGFLLIRYMYKNWPKKIDVSV